MNPKDPKPEWYYRLSPAAKADFDAWDGDESWFDGTVVVFAPKKPAAPKSE